MLDLELYMTDFTKETEGTWLQYAGGRARFKVRRHMSPLHVQAEMRVMEGVDLRNISAFERYELDLKVEAEGVFIDFEGIRHEGKELENSLENRIKILRSTDLRRFIMAHSHFSENFRAVKDEPVEKEIENLGESSSGT